MRIVRSVLACIWLGSIALAGEAVPKAPVPEAALLKESEKLVKELFKDEYAKRGAEEKKAFAAKLLQQGLETKDDAASRYVLLREAVAVAAAAGDAETGLKAADNLARYFETDGTALKLEVLSKAGAAAVSADATKGVARAYLNVVDDAIAADNYDGALRLASAGETAARKAQDLPLITQLQARAREIRAMQVEFGKVKAAAATLLEQPDNAEANLTVGRFRCFVKQDWAGGLALLAKSSDAALQELAQRDLNKGDEPAQVMAVADDWFTASEKLPAAQKAAVQQRAATLYYKVVDRLTGLHKTRVQARLAPFPAPDMLAKLTNQNVGTVREGADGLELTQPDHGPQLMSATAYAVPVRIETMVKTDSFNICLFYGPAQLMFNWDVDFDQLKFYEPVGKKWLGAPGGRVPKNTFVKITWDFEAGQVSVRVNDEERPRWTQKGDYAAHQGRIGIGAGKGSTITVKSFSIKSLGK